MDEQALLERAIAFHGHHCPGLTIGFRASLIGLRELGVVRGVRDMAAPSRRRCVAIEALVPGRFHSTSRGQCFVVEQRYALDTCHGDLSLAASSVVRILKASLALR